MRRALLIPVLGMALVLGWLGTSSMAWADHGHHGYRPPVHHGYHGGYHSHYYSPPLYRPPHYRTVYPTIVTPWFSFSIDRCPPPPPPPPRCVVPYRVYPPVVVW